MKAVVHELLLEVFDSVSVIAVCRRDLCKHAHDHPGIVIAKLETLKLLSDAAQLSLISGQKSGEEQIVCRQLRLRSEHHTVVFEFVEDPLSLLAAVAPQTDMGLNQIDKGILVIAGVKLFDQCQS